ncbi:MAG: hypothetical protein HYS98_07645 [Deltaproteobacteria bacterium]|nr:hypothetical protein [Deltaproteobacteria bacterium]
MICSGHLCVQADSSIIDSEVEERYPILEKIQNLSQTHPLFRNLNWAPQFLEKYARFMEVAIHLGADRLGGLTRFHAYLIRFLDQINQDQTLRDIDVAKIKLLQVLDVELPLSRRDQETVKAKLRLLIDTLPIHKIAKDLADYEKSVHAAVRDSRGEIEYESAFEVYTEKWVHLAQATASLLNFPHWKVVDIAQAQQNEAWLEELGYPALERQIREIPHGYLRQPGHESTWKPDGVWKGLPSIAVHNSYRVIRMRHNGTLVIDNVCERYVALIVGYAEILDKVGRTIQPENIIIIPQRESGLYKVESGWVSLGDTAVILQERQSLVRDIKPVENGSLLKSARSYIKPVALELDPADGERPKSRFSRFASLFRSRPMSSRGR